MTGKPIFDEKGAFQGYYGAGRDVTEREETLVALRRSEGRFRALTMLATEWYWEADSDLRITRVRGAPEQEGRMAGLVQGRRLWEIESLDPSLPVDWQALQRQLHPRKQLQLVAHAEERLERSVCKGRIVAALLQGQADAVVAYAGEVVRPVGLLHGHLFAQLAQRGDVETVGHLGGVGQQPAMQRLFRPLDHRRQVQELVADMHGQHPAGRQVLEVEVDRFQRDQVQRDRVA